jgi:hypothetical protein
MAPQSQLDSLDSEPTGGGRACSSNLSKHSSSQRGSIADQLGAKVHPGYTAAERLALDRHFGDAIHETCCNFDLFDHPAWQRFFSFLSPTWNTPSPKVISTTYLDECYREVQMKMGRELSCSPTIIIGMDGATNVLSRSMSNIIAHDPRPWFVEYLRADLKKESEQEEVSRKITDCISRLHNFIGKELVNGFISDSCNSMKSVRRNLVENDIVDFAYGCGAHPLNNFCEDLLKMDQLKLVQKQALLVSKSIKSQSLLNKLYSMVCSEILSKNFCMVLYSASRWSSVNYMFCRLKQVKRVLISLPVIVENEKAERGIDTSYHLPKSLCEVIIDPMFWQGVNTCIELFDPICKCLGVLESDTATLSTSYTCFIYIRVHLLSVMSGADLCYAIQRLHYRWDRIYSPVHALAFYCDPFFRQLRINVAATFGEETVELGKGDLKSQCRKAIQLITRRHEKNSSSTDVHDSVVSQFMIFCTNEAKFEEGFRDLLNYHPRLIWSQAPTLYSTLAPFLIKIYTGPASSAGVERHHKVGKRVHTQRRNRTGGGKVERQVAIAHNTATITRQLSMKRHQFELTQISTLCSDEKVGDSAAEPDELVLALMRQEEEISECGDEITAVTPDSITSLLSVGEMEEQDALLRRLLLLSETNTAEDILDQILFASTAE